MSLEEADGSEWKELDAVSCDNIGMIDMTPGNDATSPRLDCAELLYDVGPTGLNDS